VRGRRSTAPASVRFLVTGQKRHVADPVEPDECALLLAIGGDGTVLAALDRAGPAGKPVLGIAMGSLGALTSAPASRISEALDRFADGDWEARDLTGLVIERDGVRLEIGINDVVVVRRGSGQVILSIDVDGAAYARTAGDGVIVATSLGSSAYTLAAGGPLLGSGHDGMVITPLADHAGFVPPLVLTGAAGSASRWTAGGRARGSRSTARQSPTTPGRASRSPFAWTCGSSPAARGSWTSTARRASPGCAAAGSSPTARG